MHDTVAAERPLPSIDRLLGEIARFRSESRDGWAGVARVSRAEELIGALGALDAACVDAVRDADRDQAWAGAGYKSITGWVAHRCQIARAAAAKYARQVKFLDRFDRTAKAFDADDLSVAQVDRLARVSRRNEQLYGRDEELLLECATDPSSDLDELVTVTEQWRLYAADHYTPKESGDLPSYLETHVGFGGYLHLTGALEPRLGAVVQDALDEAMGPPADDDSRPVAERRAEALGDVCARVQATDEDKRARVNVDVIVDLAVLTEPERFDPDHSYVEAGRVGPIRRTDLRTIACDARVARILTKGRNQVVEVGERTRIVPLWLRRALNARDRHCQHPGCTTHHSRCDAHHLTHWANGGATELENLRLLCSKHHHQLHREEHPKLRPPNGRIDPHHDPP